MYQHSDRRPSVSIGYVFLFVLAIVGCSGGDELPYFRSRLTSESDLRLVQTSSRFSGVRDVSVSSGLVWVLDSEPPFLTRVEVGGGEALSFGNRGDGPAELREPRAIQPSFREGSLGIMVWDFGASRLLVFDQGGVLQESLPFHQPGPLWGRLDLAEVSFLDPYRVRATDSLFFVTMLDRRLDRASDLAYAELIQATSQMAPTSVVFSYANHRIPGSESLKEWAHHPVWDLCDGQIVLWSPKGQRLVWMDYAGRVEKERSIHFPRVPIRLRDVERYLERMARLELGTGQAPNNEEVRRLARSYRDRFARFQPSVTALSCGEHGTVWLRLFGTDPDPLGGGPDWLQVKTIGEPTAFRFPRKFTPFVFSWWRILGVVEIPTEGQALAWMKIEGL